MSNYIHGSQPEEQARLAKLNDLINQKCIPLLELQSGEKALDVGSGLGQFTMLMAKGVGPEGRCVGIERDKNQLKGAMQNLEGFNNSRTEFRHGNAENLELTHEEWGTFDVAHARFVLEHVHQPESVVRGMAKAVRQGGRVVILDDDHEGLSLYPEPAGFGNLWDAYIRSYDRLGNNPFVGRRLVSLLYHGGLREIRSGVVFFGDSGESATFGAYMNNLAGLLYSARDYLIKESLISEIEFTSAMESLSIWSERPDAAMWYTIYWAMGKKAGGSEL